jgi:hypothetical protein
VISGAREFEIGGIFRFRYADNRSFSAFNPASLVCSRIPVFDNDGTYVIYVFFVVNYPDPDSGFPNDLTDSLDLLFGHAGKDRQ